MIATSSATVIGTATAPGTASATDVANAASRLFLLFADAAIHIIATILAATAVRAAGCGLANRMHTAPVVTAAIAIPSAVIATATATLLSATKNTAILNAEHGDYHLAIVTADNYWFVLITLLLPCTLRI